MIGIVATCNNNNCALHAVASLWHMYFWDQSSGRWNFWF